MIGNKYVLKDLVGSCIESRFEIEDHIESCFDIPFEKYIIRWFDGKEDTIEVDVLESMINNDKIMPYNPFIVNKLNTFEGIW